MKVFVYGTLKLGYHNHGLLGGLKNYIGEGILHDYGVFDLPYGFPGVDKHIGGYVVGEVYEVDEETLKVLDRLEGYSGVDNIYNMYNRREGIITLSDGWKVEAYFYEWNGTKPPTEPYIDNGRWVK